MPSALHPNSHSRNFRYNGNVIYSFELNSPRRRNTTVTEYGGIQSIAKFPIILAPMVGELEGVRMHTHAPRQIQGGMGKDSLIVFRGAKL